jgi:subtilisin family serine protease
VIHDCGVDINHPDLVANIGTGWDFDNDDNNATNNACAHGTACAGVVAAAANGLGVVGIAPNCQIIPLRAAESHTWETWADTFDWAAQHGDIISCSWTLTPNNTLSDAIRDAVSTGAPVFCATANGGTSPIGYPASLDETIAVGASTNQDVRATYSQWGAGIDFLAPSSGGTRRIETTDIQGTNGYNTTTGTAGDYCNAADATGFGGTSSATPLAAGVAALMLSVNPGLTPGDIRAIMRETAIKIYPANANYDANGWSDHYGYGRISAAAAVHAAGLLQRLNLPVAEPAGKVILFGGGDAGGIRIGPHGVTPIPPFDPGVRLHLRAIAMLLRVQEQTADVAARQQLAASLNTLTSLAVGQIEEVVGAIDATDGIIFQDDHGGFTCGADGAHLVRGWG